VIAGLEPGPQVLRAEPLDDAEIDSFFDRTDLDTDFAPAFHEQLVVVPRGGSTERVDIAVSPR